MSSCYGENDEFAPRIAPSSTILSGILCVQNFEGMVAGRNFAANDEFITETYIFLKTSKSILLRMGKKIYETQERFGWKK